MTPSLPPEPPRSLRLDIDALALRHNWQTLDRLSGDASAGAAVKANAYGLGVDAVLPVLREAGCSDWWVAHWSEVPAVLAHVAPQQVSVLHGPLRSEDAAFATATGVRPVLNSMAQVDIWLQHGTGPCDVMVDTGMSRLGLPMEVLGDPRLARLDIDILLSHLASADEDSAQNERQRARFADACAILPARRRSLANSAGIVLGAPYHHDLTRPGLSLYGGVPRSELDGEIRQVAHVSAALIQCRDLEAGDAVGYNATYVAPAPMRAGIVSLGYADGFLRCWGGKGWLAHGDVRLPLIGRVSMDMIAVDLSAAQHLKEGEWLTVPYALPEAARSTGLSQYELLTLLGSRFSR